jgi:hypothetical protein
VRLRPKDFGLSGSQRVTLTKLEDAIRQNPALFDADLEPKQLAKAAAKLRAQSEQDEQYQ